jgi:hypothetical protein
LNAVREEDLRKQRIPIQIVLDLIDKVFQSIGPTLKAAKGKKLTTFRPGRPTQPRATGSCHGSSDEI